MNQYAIALFVEVGNRCKQTGLEILTEKFSVYHQMRKIFPNIYVHRHFEMYISVIFGATEVF